MKNVKKIMAVIVAVAMIVSMVSVMSAEIDPVPYSVTVYRENGEDAVTIGFFTENDPSILEVRGPSSGLGVANDVHAMAFTDLQIIGAGMRVYNLIGPSGSRVSWVSAPTTTVKDGNYQGVAIFPSTIPGGATIANMEVEGVGVLSFVGLLTMDYGEGNLEEIEVDILISNESIPAGLESVPIPPAENDDPVFNDNNNTTILLLAGGGIVLIVVAVSIGRTLARKKKDTTDDTD